MNRPTGFFPALSWIPTLFRQNQEENISSEFKSVFNDPLGILWQKKQKPSWHNMRKMATG
jgi:hypothetical protein